MSSSDETTAPMGQPLVVDPLVGATLGDYRVLEPLAHGGMGALYRGEQPIIGRPVAIKVLLPEAAVFDPTSDQRMLAEARAANAVRHPNIIDIFSFGTLPDGRPYMVMELLEGRSLADELAARGRLSWKQVRVVLEQALSALEAAHAAGVVHRDLKPANMFVSGGPDGWRIKLIDFGIARRVDTADAKLTKPGMVMGTPGFMAPEQVRGEPVITAKADVYSLGLVAWTLLMGREPFEGGAVVEVLNRHLSSPLPALSGVALPSAVEELLRRMTHKEPDRRPHAAEARAALARIGDAAPGSRAPWAAIGAAAAALLAAATFAALSFDEPVGAVEPAPVPVMTAPPRPAPVAPAPSPAEVEVAPPVVAGAPKVAGYDRTWPCASVAQVTPRHIDGFNSQWHFFSIAFDHERSLVVYVDGTKKARADRLVARRDAVAACKGTGQLLAARKVDDRHVPFRTNLSTAFGGDVVELDDFAVVPAP